MIVAITGGRDRTPTLAELEQLDHLLGCEVEPYRRARPLDIPALGATCATVRCSTAIIKTALGRPCPR